MKQLNLTLNKLNSIWEPLTIDNLKSEKCKDGYICIQHNMRACTPPNFFLNGSTEKDPKWVQTPASKVDVGLIVLHDVFLYKGGFFIKDNQVQEYNFSPSKKNSVEYIEIPEKLIADVTIEYECFFPLPRQKHWGNYGSWLAHIIPQISNFKQLNKNIPIFVDTLSTWQSKILKHFFPNLQISESEKCIKNNIFFFKKLIIPIEKTIYNLSQEEHAFFYPANIGLPRKRRVYLSRLSKKNPNYRMFINEQEICNILSKKGFEIIVPEKLDIFEMQQLIHTSSYIFGAGGAGMFNVLMAHKDTQILSIETSNWITHHAKLFSRAELTFSMIQGETHQNNNIDQPNFTIDTVKFKHFLETSFQL